MRKRGISDAMRPPGSLRSLCTPCLSGAVRAMEIILGYVRLDATYFSDGPPAWFLANPLKQAAFGAMTPSPGRPPTSSGRNVMSFVYLVEPPGELGLSGLWFLFHEDRILVRAREDATEFPQIADQREISLLPARKHFVGMFDDTPCFTAELDEPISIEGASYVSLRSLLGVVPDDMFALAGRAFQIMDWARTSRFCGKCGAPTEPVKDERAMACAACQIQYYPRVSPAVIVAIVREGKILLAHGRRFPSVFFSVLAGFVEAGENFEECVCREIKEEAGIEVKNIRYFGSQPWPFPNTLMVGFTAEYAGGELVVEEKEIVQADWFDPGEVRRMHIPRGGTISRRLIDWFLETYGNADKERPDIG